ncbi:MAG TPA: hypothetical protein VH583_24445 [Vicinamibacterales bacterium]|jgi:hypothetical protein
MRLATWVVLLLASSASIASAQSKGVAPESQRKLAELFAQLDEKTCEKVSDKGDVWECTYRGTGLRQISVRALLLQEDVIDADVLMTVSVFATMSDFPDTPDFLRRLLNFNSEIDFGKISPLNDGRLTIMTACPIRLVDKQQLVLMLDQAAAINNEAFDKFGKDAKK